MADPGPVNQSNPAFQAAEPTSYLHPQTLARLGTLELRAKLIVEGVMSGMHRSPYHGFSVEFAQHRQYAPGDDLRHLDWKVYGRSDKLYLKQYEQETNLDLVLLVDTSGSMDFGTRSYETAAGDGTDTSNRGSTVWTKFDHATATAAALAFLAIRQGDRVGLGMFADELVDALDRNSQAAQWRRIVRTLSTEPVHKPTDFMRVMDQVIAKLNNKCLVAIISDFFTDPMEIRTALARFKHRGHDVILLRTIDGQEATFDLGASAPFQGLEGEGKVRLDPRQIRDAYLQSFNAHTEELERIVRGFGFEMQTCQTDRWLGPAIASFMARRAGALKKGGSK